MNKFHFSFDKTQKNNKFKKILLKKYKNFTPNLASVIVVLGGDGYMLQALKKYQKYKKPFYGINGGTFGFLMNKNKDLNISKSISKAKSVSISPLEMKVKTQNNKINEFKRSNSTARFKTQKSVIVQSDIFNRSSTSKRFNNYVQRSRKNRF